MNFVTDWLGRGRTYSPAKKEAAQINSRHETKMEQKNATTLTLFSGLANCGHEANLGDRARHSPALAYQDNPVVHRAIRLIAEATASIPLLAYEGARELDEHPALSLLNNPNEREAGTAMLEGLYASLLIYGNAYLQIVEIENTPREIHRLDPARMNIRTDANGWTTAFEYQTGGRRRMFINDPEFPPIVHIKMANPLDETHGMSPLQAAIPALGIHDAASVWNRALLENAARPSGALVYSQADGLSMSEDQFNRLKQELDEGYSGAVNAGKPMLLEGGLDWKAMGYSPKDMDFIEAKNASARDITLALGIPPMLLGIPGDNTYANYREANRAFWLQTVLPLAGRTANALGQWLSLHYGSELRIAHDTDQVEALSQERDLLWKRMMDVDFLTINEKREALGYSPLDSHAFDGENIPQGNQGDRV